jgi:hypothetical protein
MCCANVRRHRGVTRMPRSRCSLPSGSRTLPLNPIDLAAVTLDDPEHLVLIACSIM